ncbi:MAG TPA: hypothetical protein VGT78_11815 [Rhizomicrobium sp.]|nr:hypothetical protein [Rhizomicrobium sp.]
MSTNHPLRLLPALLILTALVTVAYWVSYFTGGDVRVVDARWYSAFESSFPVADAWLAATAFVAGIGLWRGRGWGARAGLLAASALLYLAAMDITFDIENGLYALVPHSPPMRFELLINLWSLALGIVTLVVSWKRTRNLTAL